MISLVIGLLLSAAIVKIYADTSQIYKFQSAVSAVQENGRFASTFLRRAVRLAGNFGCSSADADNTVSSTPGIPAHLGFVTGTTAQPIGGSEGGGVAGVKGENSDELILRGSTGGGIRLAANGGPDSDLTVEANSGLTANSFAVISDCDTTHLFEIKGVAGTTISHTGTTKEYTTDKGARVQEVQAVTYCIGRATAWTAANTLMALRRLINPGAGQNCPNNGVELVEGIQNLQVRYGIDTGGDGFANRYVTAPAAGHADWALVKTLRIELLVRSLSDNITSTAVPPTLEGAAIPLAANDRHLYKVMTNTMTLRNKGT